MPEELSLYEQIMIADSVEDMYILICQDMDVVAEFSDEELQAIYDKATELNDAEESADYADLVDTLQYIAGEYDLNGAVVLADWTGQTTGNHTLKGTVTISKTVELSGDLTLTGSGTIERASGFTGALFHVVNGKTLTITGDANSDITIDGKSVIAQDSLIKSDGAVILKNVIVQNGKNRSTNGRGGGIFISATGSLTMGNCIVTKNTASECGGGIYCNGEMTIKDSTISWNRAASAETGVSVVNKGRGGGFYLDGANASGSLANVVVEYNAAMYYGGGGQVSGSSGSIDDYSKRASLTMKDGTVFRNNTAILHGAGALHVTAGASFTMEGGSMENNVAHTVGGAIHSSYTCVLNLNAGKILNNTSYGRGGGVHINTGGALTLGAGIEISGNKVYNQAAGSAAELDDTGDNWSNVKYEGQWEDNGYGGGVLIDSGTCIVEGATIKDNYAEVGGGGIALVMLNVSGSSVEHLLCVNFSMTSGEISGNTTDGNGAGVYMMSNKAEENIKKVYEEGTDAYNAAIDKLKDRNLFSSVPEAKISGGTVTNNTAQINGGGLYLDKDTKFVIEGSGTVSNNSAVNGGGVYIASGTAEINGGTMSENKVTQNGGALYVNGGTLTMYGGTVTQNYAVKNGGGAYVSDGDFNMISGTMSKNGESQTGVTEIGGAVYVIGGNIVIGVKDCDMKATTHGNTDTAVAVEHSDKTHPVVTNNTAVFGGGLGVENGTIDIYCCNIVDNTSDNRGTGMNVFSNGDSGVVNFHGGIIGEDTDHGMVVIGGQLNVTIKADDGRIIHIKYHSNYSITTTWEGEAPNGFYLNLPYCPTNWETDQNKNKLTFVGWTYKDNFSGDTVDLSYIRDKDDYKALGEPVKIHDADPVKKGTDENGNEYSYIDFYAVWAPMTSAINYEYVIDGILKTGSLYEGNLPASYDYSITSDTIVVPNPAVPGYNFLGWVPYTDGSKISNWGIASTYAGSGLNWAYTNSWIDTISRETKWNRGTINTLANFGDITLVAVYETAYVDLTIEKSCANLDENQSFIFYVTGNPTLNHLADIDITVCINDFANGKGTVTIKHVPVGEYTVKEDTSWSWRYTTDSSESTKPVNNNYKFEFTNTRSKIFWLSGEAYCENWFKKDEETT